MSRLWTDFDLTQPTAVGARRHEIPFSDSKPYLFEEDYIQDIQYWRQLELDALYVPSSSGTSADLIFDYYLVAESSPQPQGGGVVKWTRTYAAIPEPRIEWESYAHTFPGLEDGTLGPLRYISGGTNASGVTTLTTTVSHGISVGQQVIIKYTNQLPDGTQIGRQVLRTALAGTSGTSLKVSIIVDNYVALWLTAQSADIGRDPFTEEVASWLQYDYFLPGVSANVTSFKDITIFNSPVIVDADGHRVTTYGATTAPTKTEYLTDVANKAPQITNDSTLRRWRGNIVERTTRYIIPK